MAAAVGSLMMRNLGRRAAEMSQMRSLVCVFSFCCGYPPIKSKKNASNTVIVFGQIPYNQTIIDININCYLTI